MIGARLQHAVGDTRGTEVLEFAFVFPLVLLVLVGILDMGFLFNNYEVVTNAAREGARVGALPGWTDDEVKERVRSYVVGAGLDAAAVMTTVQPDALVVAGHNVQSVKVVVSYPYNYLLLGAVADMFQGKPLGTGLTLTASATMRKELAAGL
jgi:Flp pilus assembly protein TadG